MSQYDKDLERYIEEVRQYKHQTEDEHDPYVITRVLTLRKCAKSLIDGVIKAHGTALYHHDNEHIVRLVLSQWGDLRPNTPTPDRDKSHVAWVLGSHVGVSVCDAAGKELQEVSAGKQKLSGAYGFTL